MSGSSLSPNEYRNFLESIKARIQQARINASRLVNKELTLLYQSIGKQIVDAQQRNGWGKSIVDNLSKDLVRQLPGNSGFSARNLWLMRT
jgi:vacuolar-type H+-ATPase subunit E/Vma4